MTLNVSFDVAADKQIMHPADVAVHIRLLCHEPMWSQLPTSCCLPRIVWLVALRSDVAGWTGLQPCHCESVANSTGNTTAAQVGAVARFDLSEVSECS